METKKLIREIDFHLLDLRYSHTRIKNDKALARMQHSVHTYGQIVPALAVPAAGKFVLIDGYLRLSALKACGRDCIKVLLMDEEPGSLLTLLAKTDDRQLETVEQATLIQELHNRFSYSLAEIARRLGKDKSWVKRRLDLLESLPEEVLVAVMNGTVSSWAASRILVPLSRANEQDCIDLTRKIIADPLSTRELVSLYDHYKTSNRTVRDRIVANPSLFSKTTKQLEEQKLGQQINEGPEGKWFKDISIVCHILKRLKKTVDSVLYPVLDSHHRNRCQIWLTRAEKIIAELQEQTKRKNHDNSGIPTDHS
jgi:ParB family transcriptional regulator, chromosome partitioning protein